MPLRRFGSLLHVTYRHWRADKAQRLGAALAYYAVFSLAPLLLLAVALASLYYGPRAARGELQEKLADAIGPQAATAVQDLLGEAHFSGGTWAATLVGLGMALFGASGVFLQLQDALNTIWRVEPSGRRGPIRLLLERFWSFLAVVLVIALVLVSLGTGTLLDALS